ncbi:MAG: glucan biosynthesis protein [Gammaproteobacteria bacterium]|nr:glucan biosynthesis protein [Gammaproteobacteria bacterium]
MNRRDFLLNAAATVFGAQFAPVGQVFAAPVLGQPAPFSIDRLRQKAKQMAGHPLRNLKAVLPKPLKDISPDQYRAIRYRDSEALWGNDNLAFSAQFFHLGFYYETPVRAFEVLDGKAREIRYDPNLFDFSGNSFDFSSLGRQLGFAGMRLHYPLNSPGYDDELIAFRSASDFRALGKGMHYGASARGLTLGTATEQGEEFPVFTEFYLERPRDSHTMVVHALMESESTTGAYTFTIRPGQATITDVALTLYPRKRLQSVGIAPLTSMFFFGANDRVGVDDYRPAVHSSDGLMIWNGAGEKLWRPLVNPKRLRISSFMDRNPQGFGLMQRGRNFDEYQDLDARYELCPSVWIEPVGNWGSGVVRLIEIPTKEQINDNIVAFWMPDEPIQGGAEFSLTYRLHWCYEAPVQAYPATVVDTRVGKAGEDERRFIVDFLGTILPTGADGRLQADVSASKGGITNVSTRRNEATGTWRVSFDLRPEGDGPTELRCQLKSGSQILSETWTYQWSE